MECRTDGKFILLPAKTSRAMASVAYFRCFRVIGLLQAVLPPQPCPSYVPHDAAVGGGGRHLPRYGVEQGERGEALIRPIRDRNDR